MSLHREHWRINGDSYIYRIEVDHRVYIGQSESNTLNRIAQHIRAAYYSTYKDDSLNESRNLDSEAELHERMKQYRIQDLKITIFDSASDYGIAGFDDIYNKFLEEWAPIGHRITKNEDKKDGPSKIDFAEIYHILHAVLNGDRVFNKDMGGKVSGFEYIKNTDKNHYKTLMKSHSPDKALSLILLGGDQANALTTFTRELYDEMFSPNWPSIYENKYSNNFKSSFGDIHVGRVTKDQMKTWEQFFVSEALPWLEKTLGQSICNSLRGARDDINQQFMSFVSKNFLQPKSLLAQDILRIKFKDNKIKCPFNIETQFDLTNLSEYIANVIELLIVRDSKGKLVVTSNKAHKNNISDFKPLNATVTWNLHKPRSNKDGSWLTNGPTPKGRPIEESFLRWRSIYLFDYVWNSIKDTNPYERLEARESKTWGKNIINASYEIESKDWLSARMRDAFAKHIPAYSNNWFDYYRPMVNLWRNYHNMPEFQELEQLEKEYYGYENDEYLRLYSKIKNFITDSSADIASLIIY